MKRTILTVALSLGLVFSIQAQDNEAFKKDAIKLAKMGSNAAEASMDQVYKMVPDEKLDKFKQELNPIMENFFNKLGEKSMEYYTHDEVKAILKFYESEIGKRYLKVQEEITKLSAGSMGQELQLELMPIMEKYLGG